MRVATLLPSATEIVYRLGVEPVAVSHECDFPPSALEKPSATRSRIDSSGTSEAIDTAVIRAQENGGGLYDIDLDCLRRTDPDVIITQGICEVCAVDTVVVESAIERLDRSPSVLTLDPHRLSDVFDDIDRIGRALDRSHRAAEVIERLRERVERVKREVTPARDGPSVAVLDWMDPVMVAGHWMPELVELAGGRYDLAQTGDRSRPRRWSEILDADPDVIIVAPCGFEPEQTRENIPDLTERKGWESLTAVQTDRVFVLDGHHYVNRPGPRLVDTVELLSECIHLTIGEPSEPKVLKKVGRQPK